MHTKNLIVLGVVMVVVGIGGLVSTAVGAGLACAGILVCAAAATLNWVLETTVPAKRLPELRRERVLAFLEAPLTIPPFTYAPPTDVPHRLKEVYCDYLNADPLTGMDGREFSDKADEAMRHKLAHPFCRHDGDKYQIHGIGAYYCIDCGLAVKANSYADSGWVTAAADQHEAREEWRERMRERLSPSQQADLHDKLISP